MKNTENRYQICLDTNWTQSDDRLKIRQRQLATKGQVALEGNFRFVLDKSDLKSASDKKFVRKATVALKNKICEQNTTPCFSALSSVN